MTLSLHHLRSAALSAAVATFIATIGDAQALAAPSATESAGLAKFDQGKKAYEAQDWSTALAAFQASFELLPSPNTRLYIARCFRQLGKFASAHTQYELAAREAKDRVAATGEKRYAATVEAATKESAEVAGKVSHLTLDVPEVVPSDLEIRVDDSPVAKSGWGTASDVDPGSHVVTANGQRLRPFKAELQIGEGKSVTVKVELERLPTASLQATLVTVPQGLAVNLDGKPLDPSKLGAGIDLDPGTHHLVVQAPGYRDFVWDGRVEDGEAKKLSIVLTAAPGAASAGTPSWLFFGVAGLSVASLSVATVFAAHAKSTADGETAKPPLARDPAIRDDVRATSTRANILYVTGAALALGAGVLFFTTKWSSDEKPPASHTAFAPWISPTVAGAAFEGRF